jgi:hypothetical protein
MGHMKTVKIGKKEYDAIKALALRRGQFLSYHLNQAVKQYLAAQEVKP